MTSHSTTDRRKGSRVDPGASDIMAAMYTAGASLPVIVEALHDAGLRTPKGRDRFSFKTVGRELQRLGLHTPSPRISSQKQPRRAQLERAMADSALSAKFRDQLSLDADGHERWTRRRNAEGFPVFGVADGDVSAVRVAYMLEHGRILERSERLRSVCGVRECVRADHHRLFDSAAEFNTALERAHTTDECVLYTNAPAGGYSRVRTQDGRELAHRMSYERRHGPIPADHHLHHLCRQTACINPAHLVPVPASGVVSHKALHILEDELAALLSAGGPAAEGETGVATGWPGDGDLRAVGSLHLSEVNDTSEKEDPLNG